MRIAKDWGRTAVIMIITILIIILLRTFVFASFMIPSLSMTPTLLSGDFILVNKLVPGPRLDIMGKRDDGQIVRLDGCGRIERNDVVVFNHLSRESGMLDIDWNKYYVKRCKGMPGDSLIIKKGLYYLKKQGKIQPITTTAGSAAVPLDSLPNYNKSPMFHPLGWTVSALGPLYIPKKGDTMLMDTINLRLYKKLIEYETGKSLRKEGDVIYMENRLIDHYTFRKNYYFIAGDNRLDSEDSRYWGLLPEDHIVGKVSYIWKSKDPHTNKYRYNRFFKPVE